MTLDELIQAIFAPQETFRAAGATPSAGQIAPTGVPDTVAAGLPGSQSGPAAQRVPFGPFQHAAPTGAPSTEGAGPAGSPAGPSLRPPTRSVGDLPIVGEPYTSASQQPPVATGSVPARAHAGLNLPSYNPRSDVGGLVGSFLAGLSGHDYESLGAQQQKQDLSRFSANKTFQALTAKGLDADTAAAAVTNPDLLKSILPSLYGGGITDDVKEYNFDMRQRLERGEDKSKLPTLGEWMRETRRTNQPIKVDAGNEWVLVDPSTHAEIGRIPKALQEAAAAKERGKQQGGAQAALPKVIESATNLLNEIDGLEKSTALNRSVGPLDQYRPSVTGGATDFDARLAQVKGQAFLQAYTGLRGGGAITEVEGQKATDAMARLSKAQNETDFRQALRDLKDVISRGVERARAMAGGDFSGSTIPGSEITNPAAATQTPAASGGFKVLGVR